MNGLKYGMAVVLAATLAACGAPQAKQALSGDVGVAVGTSAQRQIADVSLVTKVILTLAAVPEEGLAQEVMTLKKASDTGQWVGTFTKIPIGEGRSITAEAYGETLLYTGRADGITVLEGETTSVIIVCNEVNPPVQVSEWPPHIDSIIAKALPTRSGADVPMKVNASDKGGDALTYEWTASAGVFAASTSAQAFWSAPLTSVDFTATITITVTDTAGNKASVSFPALVKARRGAIATEMWFNNGPVFENINITPGLVGVGETAVFTVKGLDYDAFDADAPILVGGFKTTCPGTWTPSYLDFNSPDYNSEGTVLSGTPVTFTPSLLPAEGFCQVSLTLTSGSGDTLAHNTAGELFLYVGSPVQPK
jgi:hypothetical protein